MKVTCQLFAVERALKAKDDEQAALTGIEIRFGGNLGVEGGE